MRATVHDLDTHAQLVQTEVRLGAGLESPVSPPMHFTLPRGYYQLRIQLDTADGRRVVRARSLDATRDTEVRIDL
jgi:hypothetical protein